MPSWFVSTRFKPWFLIKAAQLLVRSVLRLMRVPADIYHAHDEAAMPACYVVARLRRKFLIFDAHELPFSRSVNWVLLYKVAVRFLFHMIVYCSGVITMSLP